MGNFWSGLSTTRRRQLPLKLAQHYVLQAVVACSLEIVSNSICMNLAEVYFKMLTVAAFSLQKQKSSRDD